MAFRNEVSSSVNVLRLSLIYVVAFGQLIVLFYYLIAIAHLGLPLAPTTHSLTGNRNEVFPSDIHCTDQCQRLLIILPTVPYIYKGADQRLLHVLGYITNHTNLQVTLAYFQSLTTETGIATDDAEILKGLRRSFLNLDLIFGPLGADGLAGSKVSFDVVMFWNWFNLPYIQMIINSVRQLQIDRGQTRVVALVDDDTVSLRAAASELHLKSRQLEDVVLSSRPPERTSPIVRSNHSGSPFLKALIDAELTTYQQADMVVCISNNSLCFLNRFVEGQTFDVLRYSVTKTTSTYRRHSGASAPPKRLIFVGYNNVANNNGLSWFVRNVLPQIRTAGVILHVVGYVICPRLSNVICEGRVENLDKMYGNVSIAINPALESSGVATKTCAALQRGIPVVTNTFDGTVSHLEPKGALERHGMVICPPGDADCTAAAVDRLLSSPALLTRAGDAAVRFIRRFYSEAAMFSDLERILHRVRHRALRLLLIGDSHLMRGLLHELTNQPRLSAFHAKDIPSLSAIPTGVHFHFVIQLGWPLLLRSPPTRMCGASCRLVLWLPWQVGDLLQAWKSLLDRYDDVWIDKELSAAQVRKSSVDLEYMKVMPSCRPAQVDSDRLRNLTSVHGSQVRRLARSDSCWKNLASISLLRLSYLLDAPGRRVGRRESWMFSNHHRLLGPALINCTDHCSLLRSRNGRWRLDLAGNATLTVEHYQSFAVRWKSRKKNSTATSSRCSLHLGLDCQLILKDYRQRIVWTSEAKVDHSKLRHQCFVYMRDDGVVSVTSWSSGREIDLWKSS